jgi:hypothetical protein
MSWREYSKVTSTPRTIPTRIAKSYFRQSQAKDGATIVLGAEKSLSIRE